MPHILNVNTTVELPRSGSLALIADMANEGSDAENPLVGALIDGDLIDLVTEIPGRSNPYTITWVRLMDSAGRHLLRHSMAHLTAQAVQRLYGQASPKGIRICQGFGPATDDGFFQEFDFAGAGLVIGDNDLEQITCMMQEIVAEALSIQRRVVTRQAARAVFADDPLKQQIIDKLPDGEPISVYIQGEYKDLCRGPHVPNTALLGAFRLLRVSTGTQVNASGVPLIRITGTGFAKLSELEVDTKQRDEALKRDHRKIGPAMSLFYLSEKAPGSVFFLPHGTRLRQILMHEKRQLLEARGFQEVVTPTLFRKELWLTSGHWQHYRENMFCVHVGDEEDIDYALKPMNCPGHVLLYQMRPHSYRELPLRLSEFGTVHRYERSGVLSGLHRTRTFTQDDAHMFVRRDQLAVEVTMLIQMYILFYSRFGFKDLKVRVSTRPVERLGTDDEWDDAEGALISSLRDLGIQFQLKPGDGAFYGPKIDFHLSDCLGRTWQCGTIQVDFQLPQRFDLSYVGPGGGIERPIMIHPATMGSIERFMAIIIEHYEGKFPSWLAPVQVMILPVSINQTTYAESIAAKLRAAGVRFETETSDETLSKKIRNVHTLHVPYLLILGAKEEASGTVSVRDRSGIQRNSVQLDVFIQDLQEEVDQYGTETTALQMKGGQEL